MPRKRREWFEGAVYHIGARGNHKQNIFHDQEDFQVFLNLLIEGMDFFNIKTHAYCLMTNHYHLLIETSDVAIWFFMKRQNQMYVTYYNKKYGLKGRLFDERYYSHTIQTQSSAINTSRYIHLNPVAANLVDAPEKYQWSSYNDYMNEEKNGFVETKTILKYFQSPQSKSYCEYVQSQIRGSVPHSFC